MPITPGTKLGPYEITGPIGAGGMGEVYRARDTKLDRDVAIKVLPEKFAQDGERLARFEREAKLLASLNHPNIASIYGFESGALVLEFVEGPTLAERIQKGPIPIEEALTIAKQIAEALEAGHEAGIIHRDLKPANIKVREDGTVKVLDYGLAKALEGAAPGGTESELSQSPTLTRQGTQMGVILGTAAYMSPEQAKGKRMDRRADIWALGCVLFEMLSGRRPFQGEDVSDILASVLKVEPVWNALPDGLDPRLVKLLRRCLQKDPKKRQRDVGDVRLELEGIVSEPALEKDTEPVATESSSRRTRTVAISAAVAFALSVVTGLVVWNLKPVASRSVTRFTIPLAEDEAFSSDGRHLVAISPSGSHLVYVANDRLNRRALDQMEAVPVPGTEGASSPFFSPDGKWIGFHAEGSLKKVALAGGTPVTLCEAANPFGASWSKDGSILYGQGPFGIWRVSSSGGAPERIVEMQTPYASAASPQIVAGGPDGNLLLYTWLEGGTDWDNAQTVAQSLDTGGKKVLLTNGSDARFVSTGHLVYADGNTLMAVAMEPGGLEIEGEPVPVVERVLRAQRMTGAAQFAVSDSGSLAFVPGAAWEAGSLAWVDRSGSAELITSQTREWQRPRLSPQGDRLAVGVVDENARDIWILDIARDTLTRLTNDGTSRLPVWSPDGEWIAFGSNGDLYRKRSDFTGSAELLLEKKRGQNPAAWSKDGRWLVFTDTSTGAFDIWAFPLDGEPQPVVQSPSTDTIPCLSPDGRFMAYMSNESGRFEIYVVPFPEGGGKTQISTESGVYPLWSADGRELFYIAGLSEAMAFQKDQVMMVVPVSTEPEFEAGTPTLLFKDPPVPSRGRDYDVSPDGQRFVMLQPPVDEDAQKPRVNVVLNWFEELKRLVPMDN